MTWRTHFGLTQRNGNLRRVRASRLRELESLEPKLPMAANVLITEIVANNQQGLKDEDGDREDWIELYNAGDEPQNLSGWHLTDDAADLNQWTFPAVTIQPEQFLIVYASGKDRAVADAPLHTNFRLNQDGEYLALVKADGKSIASDFAPAFPAMEPDRSYGRPQASLARQVFTTDAAMNVLVPSVANGGDQLGLTWTQPNFDDSTWIHGADGVGFDAATGFEDYFSIDVEAQMFNTVTSAFVRIPFNLDNPYAAIGMRLRMQYDDGYVAYLNGTPISLRNTAIDHVWNSAARTTRRETLGIELEETDQSAFLGQLRSGQNVLAIQGLNSSTSSDDFLIAAELEVSVATTPENTLRIFARPSPAAPNGTTSYVGLITPVTVSAERGMYDGPFSVTLSNDTAGASLVYTTDGSVPSAENGTLIPPADADSTPEAEIFINKTTTLRIAAIKNGYLTSVVNTQTYLILSDIVNQTEQSLLDAGYPPLWNRTAADYGVDPDVVGPNAKYDGEFASQFVAALKAAPSVSISVDMD